MQSFTLIIIKSCRSSDVQVLYLNYHYDYDYDYDCDHDYDYDYDYDVRYDNYQKLKLFSSIISDV